MEANTATQEFILIQLATTRICHLSATQGYCSENKIIELIQINFLI
jgi:hypothetical protein